DHLLLRLGEVGSLAVHQRVVVDEERPRLGGTSAEHQEDRGYEPGLLLLGEDALTQVLGQVGELRDGIAIGHEGLRGVGGARRRGRGASQGRTSRPAQSAGATRYCWPSRRSRTEIPRARSSSRA